jgi:hypothetical protein
MLNGTLAKQSYLLKSIDTDYQLRNFSDKPEIYSVACTQRCVYHKGIIQEILL